jgi:hypothetical protein
MHAFRLQQGEGMVVLLVPPGSVLRSLAFLWAGRDEGMVSLLWSNKGMG